MRRPTLLAALIALLLAAPARADETALTVTRAGTAETIPATLITPPGMGPFPAVVIVHDCSGLGPRSSGAPRRWANDLVAKGYAILLPDSFSTRGFPDGVCTATNGAGQPVNPTFRAADALGALATLKSRPDIDPKRIALMGGSHGGSTTLASMLEPGFAAAIALYPSCGARYGDWRPQTGNHRVLRYEGTYRPTAPILILAGALDDWTPMPHCEALAATSLAAHQPVDLRIYPDAHHAFDSPAPTRYVPARNNFWSPSGRGATTGGNPEAWALARQDVATFLANTLRSK